MHAVFVGCLRFSWGRFRGAGKIFAEREPIGPDLPMKGQEGLDRLGGGVGGVSGFCQRWGGGEGSV